MFCQGAPAHREDVSGVKRAPVVKGSSPAVKHDKDLLASDLSYCGRTNQVGVLPVHRLQLHTGLKVVFNRAWWFLNMNTHMHIKKINTAHPQLSLKNININS